MRFDIVINQKDGRLATYVASAIYIDDDEMILTIVDSHEEVEIQPFISMALQVS